MNPRIYIRTALLTGMLTGLVCYLSVLLFYQIGMQPLGKHFYLFMPIFAMGFTFGITYFRNYQNGGVLTTSQGLLMGLVANFLASTFYATTLYVYLQYVNDEIFVSHLKDLQNYFIQNKDALIQQTSKEAYETHLQSLPSVTVTTKIADNWLRCSILGLFIGVATGFFLRKQEKA